MIAATVAALTLREALRRKVIWALVALTAVLLGLSWWGFGNLAQETTAASLTRGETRLIASELLNLVMFAVSLIVALGAAFLAGPSVGGELESGIALSMLARPVRRSSILLGKWIGLCLFASGYLVLAGLTQFVIVDLTVGYWPPAPAAALGYLAGQSIVLLTLAMLLSSLLSPMASGVVAVGLFGATWVGGVVGGIGAAIHNDDVARIGAVSRALLPTDGLWRGAMYSIQDSSVFQLFPQMAEGFPFLSSAPPGAGYLAWVTLWIAACGGLCLLSFARRDI